MVIRVRGFKSTIDFLHRLETLVISLYLLFIWAVSNLKLKTKHSYPLELRAGYTAPHQQSDSLAPHPRNTARDIYRIYKLPPRVVPAGLFYSKSNCQLGESRHVLPGISIRVHSLVKLARLTSTEK